MCIFQGKLSYSRKGFPPNSFFRHTYIIVIFLSLPLATFASAKASVVDFAAVHCVVCIVCSGRKILHLQGPANPICTRAQGGGVSRFLHNEFIVPQLTYSCSDVYFDSFNPSRFCLLYGFDFDYPIYYKGQFHVLRRPTSRLSMMRFKHKVMTESMKLHDYSDQIKHEKSTLIYLTCGDVLKIGIIMLAIQVPRSILSVIKCIGTT